MSSSEFTTYGPPLKQKKDQSFKLKFNPKKKCSRCEQLNVFSCEHAVVIRDTIHSSFNERGKFYNHPRLKNTKDVSKSLDANGETAYEDDWDTPDSDRVAKLTRERLGKFGKPESLINNNNQSLPPLKDTQDDKTKKKGLFGKS